MARDVLDEHRLRRLIDVGRGLVAQLDLEAVLSEVVDVARELTGARYAAIGDLPDGLAEHDFLDVPIVVRGQPYGNLYLAEKEEGDFDDADAEAVAILVGWAAVAIFNVRLYAQSEEERGALERAVHGLEATTEIARAVGGETDRARVLETIAKRARALVGARSLLVLLRDGARCEVVAAAGEGGGASIGRYVTVGGESEEEALTAVRGIGIEARAALPAPLVFRGRTLGAIVALDRLEEGPGFYAEDRRMLTAAAASAAAAVATVLSVTKERLRQRLLAAEHERARWARELHDSILQGMGSRRLLLSSVLKSGDPEQLRAVVEEGLHDVVRDIEELRALITELRPATLDQLGLLAALEDLLERFERTSGVELDADVEIDAERLGPELETVLYRLVQEALNNIAKHAGAARVRLQIRCDADRVELLVSDDGAGFDPDAPTSGFGIAGMRERIELTGGELRIESKQGGGTRLLASVPLAADREGSGLDQAPGERTLD
ncbi:MAG TPA: GAF domain-containing sensor histidine kinase [Solirubrobacterales bacterium]|nr:GAF domain-containing sensor histidine kinase [Solirubrobacterales bacterium]